MDDNNYSIRERQKLTHPRRRLALELECEIFKFLKLPTQQKFIWGLGRKIYEIFGHQLLTKTKRLRNPRWNCWNKLNTNAKISPDGLGAMNTNEWQWQNVVAVEGFPIYVEHCRKDCFPGTIAYYFEVTNKSSTPWWGFCLGLSDGTIPNDTHLADHPNTFAISYGRYNCRLHGISHDFEWPLDAIKPEWNGPGDVSGCGLVLSPTNKLTIFFTLNGILMGKPIPINTSVDCLFPTFGMFNFTLEANFGDDLAKPFKYDILTCPGMVFQ